MPRSDAEQWIYPTDQGLYVAPGDFYIDPPKPVERAVISHGHADHARPGHGHVYATPQTADIMQIRYRESAARVWHRFEYGTWFSIGPVRVSLAPAGHVLGSAQIILEIHNLRVVYSGDYKRQLDPTCAPFHCVQADVFITEATFGLPVFSMPDAREEIQHLLQSMKRQPERTHVVGVYPLGKCQRVIALARQAGFNHPVFLHGALEKLCDYYQAQGIDLGERLPATVANKKELAGSLVLAPPSALREPWARRLHDPVVAIASGWMTVRQRAKQRNVELPLKISDHADWPDLLKTIHATGCRQVWITHGQEDALVHETTRRGLKARPLSLVGFEEESE